MISPSKFWLLVSPPPARSWVHEIGTMSENLKLGVQTPSLFCATSWGLSGTFRQSAWSLFGYFQAILGNSRQFRQFRVILCDFSEEKELGP